MRLFILTFILLTSNTTLFTQEEYGGNKEIYTETYNVTGNDSIHFIMKALTPVWNYRGDTIPYYMIDSFNNYSVRYNDYVIVGTTGLNWQNGYNNLVPQESTPPYFSYGLYMFTIKKVDSVVVNFFLDYRDADWGNNGYSGDNDIHIKYYGNSDKVFIYWGSTHTSDTVKSNKYYPLWEGKEKGSSPNTDFFYLYWQNSLALIDNDYHPKLIWSTNCGSQSVTSYRIYRAIKWNTETDPEENEYYYLTSVNSSTGEYTDYTALRDGHYKSYYKIKAYNGDQLVETFNTVNSFIEETWKNSLLVTSINSNPHLKWEEYSENIGGYKIYRSINTQGGVPGSFSLLATVSETTHEYTDEEINVGGNWKVYYFVRTYNSSQNDDTTRNVSITSNGFCKPGQSKQEILTLNLSQNYPNPFNPTTIINYEIPTSPSFPLLEGEGGRERLVTLKVYDLLGNEVATLVNKELPAGSYTAEFSAAGLSSGIYIYTLKAGGYTQSKKMQVVK